MALAAHIVHEMRASASNDNGGGTRWTALVKAATYKWTASGSGTSEYYVELLAGGDPSLTEAKAVTTDGTYVSDTNGTLGSLNAGEWDWGDNDTLGYSTVYVRLDDGADPDSKNDKFVSMVFGGGVDYSMQDAAQVTQTDYACVIASTTLTSATGGFTALMVGSLFHPTAGTNVLLEWFEIVTFVDVNTVTLDRTCCDGVGNATGVTGFVGGARALPVDAHFEAWTAGNKMYIEAGTYTLGAAISVAKDGSDSAYLEVIGYNTTRGDNPTGTDRPLIAAAANTTTWDNFWRFLNIRMTTTTASGWSAGTAHWRNCKVENSSGSGGREAITSNDNGPIVDDCEVVSTLGLGILHSLGSYGKVVNSYIHDSFDGIDVATADVVSGNIFDTMADDALLVFAGVFVTNNTFYNCVGDGLTSLSRSYVVNNQFVSCGIGISPGSRREGSIVDYNNYFNNTIDITNADKGPNATHNDPGFTDAAGGDFSGVDSADGFTIRLGVG